MPTIRLTLPAETFQRLADLAQAKRRQPAAQALVMLEAALARPARRARPAPASAAAADPDEVPEWMKAAGAPPASDQPDEDVPDWLKGIETRRDN